MPLATRLAYGTSIAPFQPTLACTAVALRWWSSSTSRRSPRGVRRRSASVLPPRAGTISTFSPDCVFRRTFSFTISSAEPKLSSSTTNLAMEADVAETVKTVSIVTSVRRDETMFCEAVRSEQRRVGQLFVREISSQNGLKQADDADRPANQTVRGLPGRNKQQRV